MEDERNGTDKEWIEDEVERLDLRPKATDRKRRSVRQDLHELTKRPASRRRIRDAGN